MCVCFREAEGLVPHLSVGGASTTARHEGGLLGRCEARPARVVVGEKGGGVQAQEGGR